MFNALTTFLSSTLPFPLVGQKQQWRKGRNHHRPNSVSFSSYVFKTAVLVAKGVERAIRTAFQTRKKGGLCSDLAGVVHCHPNPPTTKVAACAFHHALQAKATQQCVPRSHPFVPCRAATFRLVGCGFFSPSGILGGTPGGSDTWAKGPGCS